MASPFPGMDPFLEDPVIFPGFHDRLIIYLSEALQPLLPEPYFAETGERVWVEVTSRYIGPDVHVLRPNGPAVGEEPSGGGVALAAPPHIRPVVVTVPHDERRESRVEIYAQHGERLVTTIEMLSPTNKTPGEHGRDLYLRKQREVLDSKTNLVEIDLLRGGVHTTAVPHNLALERTGPFDYHVCIHRFDNLEDYFVYPIQLAERLPALAIPLLPGDPDVTIDLQAVFERCYDTGPYRRRIRYNETEPAPPLRPDQTVWAKELLRAHQAGVKN